MLWECRDPHLPLSMQYFISLLNLLKQYFYLHRNDDATLNSLQQVSHVLHIHAV